jgi:hypothetical protein
LLGLTRDYIEDASRVMKVVYKQFGHRLNPAVDRKYTAKKYVGDRYQAI